MSSAGQVVLLCVLLVFISNSQSALLQGLDSRSGTPHHRSLTSLSFRNFDDMQFDSDPSMVTLEDEQRYEECNASVELAVFQCCGCLMVQVSLPKESSRAVATVL